MKKIKEENYDISDEGQQAKDLIDNLEIQLAISKLPKGQQEILQMIIGGFTYREIRDELKIGQSTISGAKKALYAIIN